MLKNPAAKYRPTPPVALSDRRWPDRVISAAPRWLSTDLRDGNQALIEPMDVARKLRMFEALVAIGFKEIEIGFPSASQADFDFVRCLIEQDRIPADVTIQVLTPARAHLIERTFESLQGARGAIVHLYNATAPIMRRVVLGLDVDGIVELATSHAAMLREQAARQPGTRWTFQYSPEMFSNTELEVARRVVDAVTAVWNASPAQPCIINLPSTVENCTPNVFADMVEWMDRHLARRDGIVLCVHPHNDRGTGTASAELALMAGADRVEGCLFGNGERTGNLDLVNVALNLYTQGVSPGLDFSDIDAIRRTVEFCNQIPVHPRHPYVGELVYTSFSGSHQDAIKKAFAARRDGEAWDMPYLPIDPKDLGRSYEAVIRVNSQSGNGGISYLLETEYGLELPRRLQIEFSQQVQAVMDVQGKELSAGDLWQLFDEVYGLVAVDAAMPQPAQVDDAGDGSVRLRARIGGVLAADGAPRVLAGAGNGPVDAFVQALTESGGERIEVLDYHEHSIGSGAQARAAAYVELRVGTRVLFGVGIDANIVSASIKAVLSGWQRALNAGSDSPAPTTTA
ncbi:2-isopropylmalate synthase [Leptothrix discophora]|uniref:2-isopropylmalate synthase n=1 Tax=Leptothrix discophora TaxID=89 RepID=A0ABT9G142_LEPDI|nr:2-isopropylmalate synthase [Leptothrix discophora]MDP4300116.1 2-isopropylmalate synthase [Leptothrix discophora]